MVLSNNIMTIQYNNGYVIYHRYFGNPLLIDEESQLLIRNRSISRIFQIPQLKSELIKYGYVNESQQKETELFTKSSKESISSNLEGRGIKQLDLIVSQRCNLGCPSCIYYAGNPRNNHPSSLMNFKTALKSWKQYLKTARQNGLKVFQIHFGGAEPLTNWPLIEDILFNFPKLLQPGEEIEWTINTNVTLVTKHIARIFNKYNVEIHTSLDGNKEANDAIRMKLGGQGTFDIICNKIKQLREEGISITDLSTTLTEVNFMYFDLSFIDWLKENEITAFGIDIDLVGSPSISTTAAADKLCEIYWKCHDEGIECSGTWMTPFLNIVNKDLRNDHVAFCGAVKGHNISVTPNGEITLCAYMSSRVGHINDWDDLFLKNSSFQNLLSERQPGVDKHCVGCILEGSCAGQCHITREEAQRKEDSKVVDLMCDFYRNVTTKMLIEYCNHFS